MTTKEHTFQLPGPDRIRTNIELTRLGFEMLDRGFNLVQTDNAIRALGDDSASIRESQYFHEAVLKPIVAYRRIKEARSTQAVE